ncbi:MAG TPA: response regulator [Thermoanaerobaculia bacterium]|nr:response regulator [Thermoanaerobaculia bacterium]
MKRRILLADDSVTIQKVIELTFMDEDYEVRAVSNGDEALALLTEVNPDFVIADVHMPGANGYEVCRRSKQLRPDVPVLLLVGTFEPFDEGQTRAVGADSFLKKPFDSQELLQRVEELLASRAGAAPAASEAEAVPDFLAPSAMPGLDLPSAEPSWGSFELEAVPELAPQPFAAPAPEPFAPEPFDREPSFALEPDPSYSLDSEPVFTMEDSEPSLAVRDDVFGAPSELSFDEAPQDRYIPEEPISPVSPVSATAVAGFDWAASAPAPYVEPEPEPVFELAEPEPLRFEEPAAAVWEEPAEPAQQPAWAASPTSIFAPAYSPPEPELSLEQELSPEPAAAEPSEPAYEPAYHQPAAAVSSNGRLSDEDVDRIARRVVELLGDRTVRDVAWEVIPDMAEVIIRDRLRELEAQVE